jgi:hypothetical protein
LEEGLLVIYKELSTKFWLEFLHFISYCLSVALLSRFSLILIQAE